MSYKTVSANSQTVDKKWVLVDAEGQTLGRLASRIAFLLRGKHKPNFTPHVDCGDNVIVINAEKIRLTGNKMADKTYYRHTGYPGGIRSTTPAEIFVGPTPEKVVSMAVERMIPRGPLGRKQMSNLKIYAGSEHPHDAQQPEVLDVGAMNPKNMRSASRG